MAKKSVFTPGRPAGYNPPKKGAFLAFVVNAANSVGSVTSAASSVISKATKAVLKIPILGPILGVTTNVHLFNAIHNIAKGQRVDRAAMGSLKATVSDYRALAPYAASVVATVPGIGQGIGGGIAAAAALSEGRPLTQVALEAVKGSIPGGAIAQAAFSVAEGIANGKKIEQVAIGALPIPPQAKQALSTAAAMTRDLADGKSIKSALVARANDGLKLLAPQLRKAVQVGSAVGLARSMQESIGKQLSSPAAHDALAEIGRNISSADALINTARNLNKSPEYQKGFDIATALMNGKQGQVTQSMLTSARETLPKTSQLGFDAGTALHVGRVGRGRAVRSLGKKRPPRKVIRSLGKAVGFYTTGGLIGAAEYQKVGVMSEIVKTPDAREGAKDAITQIAASRDQRTFWQIFKQVMFGIKS